MLKLSSVCPVSMCEHCERDMAAEETLSCVVEPVEYPDGVVCPQVPYVGESPRCPDCNVASGGLHHPGCDMERCPRCGGQLITCSCGEEAQDAAIH